MAIKTNYFDGNSVAAADLIAPWLASMSDGVFGATDFAVTADSPADLAVQVAIGNAMVRGHLIRSDAVNSVPIGANTSGYNRYDLIVLEVDDTNKATALKAVQGVPSSSPTAPTASSIQLPLALVLVGNNASVINGNVITDMRYPVIPAGSYPGKGEPFYGQISAVPWDRMIADGSAVSRTQYPRLFAACGTQWGAGDGSTTFNLPDGRGATFAGYKSGDTNYGTIGTRIGEDAHVLTTPEMPSHNHPMSPPVVESNNHNVMGSGSISVLYGTTALSSTGSAGGDQPHNNIQPTNVGIWLIVW